MLSERLKTLRKKKGITQTQLAEEFHISAGTVGNWETGNREPDYETLLKLAKYFEVTVDYLLGNDEIKKSPTVDSTTEEDEELIEYLEELKNRPEMRMLFSLSKGATKKDVEDAVRIIQALRERNE
ncbi:MAG: helix-turn-helix transcriptional regulator [Clostridiales bacterium]|nr:helix-turn-helix transcriptional regulator [Clostridiales bacterium]